MIHAAFEEWRAWLVGTNEPVLVFSDHVNLQYFMKSQKLTPRQARWAAYLSSFWFHILHTPGKSNPANPPSCRPDYEQGLESRPLITQAYNSNPVVGQCPAPAMSLFKGGWWWYWDRIFVPSSLGPAILSAFHDTPSVGHPGVARMLSSLSRTSYWPDMRADVLKFVASCDSCQRVKIDTKALVGTLQPLPIPDQPWSVIGMDFIVKLPCSHSFDSIWVIVDHLTKGAHFVSCNESMSASDLASLFIQHFFCFHGLPDKIVSDRAPSFVSAFWLAVQKTLHIKSVPSTAYHPQTDGQTERTNQTLKQS